MGVVRIGWRLILVHTVVVMLGAAACGPRTPADEADLDDGAGLPAAPATVVHDTRATIDRHGEDDPDDDGAMNGGDGAADGAPPTVPVAHMVDLSGQGILHAEGFQDPQTHCAACHGADLSGSAVAPSCTACHGTVWEIETDQLPGHDLALGSTATLHRAGLYEPQVHCTACHGAALEGAAGPSCTQCHGPLWSAVMLPADHVVSLGDEVWHRAGLLEPEANCAACHGSALSGAGPTPSCTACHAQLWRSTGEVPASHVLPQGAGAILHAIGLADPATNCAVCHGADLQGQGGIPSCTRCHGELWLTAGPPFDHTVQLGNPVVFHRGGLTAPEVNCSACHGPALAGTASTPSCTLCHGPVWDSAGTVPADHTLAEGTSGILHRAGLDDPQTNCTACHGPALQGAGNAPSCTQCHGELWNGSAGPPADHVMGLGNPQVLHRAGLDDPQTGCAACHGADLTGAGTVPSCTLCHAAIWESAGGPPADHTVAQGAMGILHRPGFDDPTVNCTACHGADLGGAGVVPSCTACHEALWDDDISGTHDLALGSPAVLHRTGLDDPMVNCTACHGAGLNGANGVPACWTCHGSLWDAPPDYPPDHTVSKDGARHAPGLEAPVGVCDACHGVDLTGTPLIPSCTLCHGPKWDEHDDDGDDD